MCRLKIKIRTLLLSLFFFTMLAAFALLLALIDAEQSTHVIALISLVILIGALLFAIIFAIHTISHSILRIAHEIDQIATLHLEDDTKNGSRIEEMHLISHSVDSLKRSLRSFSRYVPKEIAQELMQKDHEISLARTKKTISILFTDITNFTSFAETLPIETVNTLLTDYFEALSSIIGECGGTIDKFIGDSIMSLWGALKEYPDSTERACTAALLCQKRLKILNEEHRKKGMPEFETRMGIKTGPVIVGNFGTSERMSYSAIGDAVNIAARLQELNKTYHTQILIGEETMCMTKDAFLVRPLETVELRGRQQKIKVYELIAKKGGKQEILPEEGQVELCALFTRALHAFDQKDYETAKSCFQSLHKKFPNDYPTKLYIKKLEHLQPKK